jgi:hypothetical protein
VGVMGRPLDSKIFAIVGGVLIGSSIFRIVVDSPDYIRSETPEIFFEEGGRYALPIIVIWAVWFIDVVAKDIAASSFNDRGIIIKSVFVLNAIIPIIVLIYLIPKFYSFDLLYGLLIGVALLIISDFQVKQS